MEPFHPFGTLHFVTVAVVFAIIALVTLWGRRLPLEQARRFGRGLGVLLLVYYFVESVVRVWVLDASPALIWPFEICSALFFIGAAALWWGHRQGFAIVSLWTFACTFHALLTPTPGQGYPSLEYFRYFAAHGLLMLIAVYVLVALEQQPTFREALGAMLALQLWELIVGVIDYFSGQNFLYLRHPPPSPTLIDALGPWPYYLGSLELIGVASFALWYGIFRLLLRGPFVRPPAASPGVSAAGT